MAGEIQKTDNGILEYLRRFVHDTGFDEFKTSYNSRTGTATVTGKKDGMQYTTTIQRNKYGETRTSSHYNVTVGRKALIEQVKQLRRQGYKQTEIADMLGISQSSVSNYLRGGSKNGK